MIFINILELRRSGICLLSFFLKEKESNKEKFKAAEPMPE
jgi:hypothetical protein